MRGTDKENIHSNSQWRLASELSLEEEVVVERGSKNFALTN